MNIRRIATASIAVVVPFAFLQPAAAADKTKSAHPRPVTIKMVPQNQSGETGTAKLTAVKENQTKVEIRLKGAPKKTAQPAHIHEGGCANLDPKPKQGLDNVVNGKSTTVVPVSLDELLKGNMAINVHKSTDDLKTYVSCGDIQAKK